MSALTEVCVGYTHSPFRDLNVRVIISIRGWGRVSLVGLINALNQVNI